MYQCVRDNSQLCLVFVHSLITCLQLKKMSVMYESAYVAITFQLLEMSSITTPNQKQFRIFAQGTFIKGFLGEISAILPICIIKKKSIWKLRLIGTVSVTGTRVNVYQISKMWQPYEKPTSLNTCFGCSKKHLTFPYPQV